jgi:hypothetical protein
MQTQLAARARSARRTPSPRSRSSRRALAGAAAALCCAATAPAAAEPGDLSTFIELRNDYTTRGDGGFVNAAVLRGDYAFNRAFSLRLDVPLVYAGGVEAQRSPGLGDVLIRPLVRVARAPRFAFQLGADLRLDSAASAALGAGRNRVAPLAQAFFGVSGGTTIGVFVQHAVSFGGDPRREIVNSSVVRPFAIIELPAGFWISPDQRFEIDYRSTPRLVSTSVLEVGKALSDRVRVYVDPGVEVSRTGPVNWLVTGGVRWAFPPARTDYVSRVDE